MLSERYIAGFLAVCLGVFFALNLYNVIVSLKRGRERRMAVDDVRRPSSLLLALATFGTLFFFLISTAYPFLVFTELSQPSRYPLQLRFAQSLWIQVVGILLQLVGYSLFLWSVIERGRHPSELVTRGPFRSVRHPSYLGYFLMFLGLLLLLLNLVALVPLVAIPGYVGLATYEEQLLVARFGDEYTKYQKRTGRFLPKMRW